MKPLIGVTADLRAESIAGARIHYLNSITRAGGIPVLISPAAPAQDLRALLDRLDGLLFTGGADVDPALYGELPAPELGALSPARDACEVLLAREAAARDMPVLGICRGLQVINVALGGSLIQDIEKTLGVPRAVHDQPEDYAVATHEVAVEPGTLLARVTGLERISVNSRHHQAVKRLAPGLRLDARSCADGVVESFDDPSKKFLLAVQWHPEMLSHLRGEAHALFRALVEAC